MEKLIERYIKLRDAKAKLKAQFASKTATLDDVLAKIEAAILQHFQTHGIDSAKTEFGTAYSQLRTSCTVADWTQALDFIKGSEAWEMLEKRVSKEAVLAHKEETGRLPPGLNWREEIVVNVRRS